MRWRTRTALCGVATALAVTAWALWSSAARTPRSTDRNYQWLGPTPPALTSSVRARAAGVPLPTALLEAQRVGLPPPTAAVPVVPGLAVPQRCMQAWKPGVVATRCGHTPTPVSPRKTSRHSYDSLDAWTGTHRRGNGAKFLSSSLGRDSVLSVAAGEVREHSANSVTMAFRNTGTSTWRVGSHALGTQCPQDNVVLTGAPRIALSHDVAPGKE
jgi:hypothetical protein